MKATENSSQRFVIGRGAHGIVYKASINEENHYAVKKLDFVGLKGATASMVREIQTVGQIRHRNLVGLEEICMRKNYRLILYKYMHNGSFYDVLARLQNSLAIRYKIPPGTAEGLSYLYQDCHSAIVHRDIKPKHMLLESEMEAHISNFGIAKPMDQSSASIQSTSIAGTSGYIAPGIWCMKLANWEASYRLYIHPLSWRAALPYLLVDHHFHSSTDSPNSLP